MENRKKLTKDQRISQALARINLRRITSPRTEQSKPPNQKVRQSKNTRPKKVFSNLVNRGSNLLLEIPSISNQTFVQYPTPAWFTKTDKAIISIIVPIFKSKDVLKDFVKSWDLLDTLNTEIIFVDDCCPLNSKDRLITEWSYRKQEIKRPIGKIIYNAENYGFGSSCNIGAKNATGNYLIFLNADVILTPDWIKPIIQLLVKPEVGIVGNMQIKHGGTLHNTIDSAGSEWNWEYMTFMHIGRNSYRNKVLKDPFKIDNAPADLFEIQEREMVTGACIAMRKKVFDEIGGFNPNYRIAYWEDSELCMAVREKGYKILYQPNSKIYHIVSHTSSGGHKYIKHNRNFFKNKWIDSGRIDSIVTSARPEPFKQVKSIVIKRNVSDGDVLIAAAIAPALKMKYPGVEIIFNTIRSKIVTNNPYIDRVIDSSQLSERSFDLYYNLDMAYEIRPQINMLEAYADVVGVSVKDCKLFIHTQPFDNLPNKYVVIHSTNSSWVGRSWPSQKFNIISKHLRERGVSVINVGTSIDNEIISDLNLLGKTTIHQLAHIIKNSAYFIGVDSLPMHIAQAFDIPGVAFFGSIDPKTRLVGQSIKPVFAEGLSCLGCHHKKPGFTYNYNCEAKTMDCINKVTTEMMLKQMEDLWQKI
jgi:GT2 family glycosyltransferase/ADP-heptose:LPS heptosyltransferase